MKTKIRDGFRGHDPKSNYSERWDDIFGKKESTEIDLERDIPGEPYDEERSVDVEQK